MKQSLGSIVACFLLLLPFARAGHFDTESIQKELEIREMRIRDLQVKFERANAQFSHGESGTATSLRKNATVIVGGMVETRYFYHRGRIESSLTPVKSGAIVTGYAVENRRQLRAEYEGGDFKIAEARLRARIEVNNRFDAYMQVDLMPSDARRRYVSGNAHQYWVRWKNIRDSGLGVLVGRNYLVFSDRDFEGICPGYQGAGFYMNSIDGGVLGLNRVANAVSPVDGRNYNQGEGMFTGWATLLPHHTGWYHFRTTQINPFWEGLDGRLRVEASFFQSLDRLSGSSRQIEPEVAGGVGSYRTLGYGPGSCTARVTWKPIEDTQLTLSAANFRQDNPHDGYTNGFDGRWGPWNLGSADRVSRNNPAINISVSHKPAFFRRLKVWGKWTRGWNEGWVRKMSSDVVNYGAALEFSKGLKGFAQADHLLVDNAHRDVLYWSKARAWAFYTGINYRFSHGADLEAGWRHEEARYADRAGNTHTKVEVDTLYAHVGFYF